MNVQFFDDTSTVSHLAFGLGLNRPFRNAISQAFKIAYINMLIDQNHTGKPHCPILKHRNL